MFRPAKMVKVDIIGIKDDLHKITALLAEAGVVHLSPIGTIPGFEDVLLSAKDDALEKRYKNASDNIRKIEDVCICGEKFDCSISADLLDFDLEEEISQIEPFLNEFTDNMENITSKSKSLDEEERKYAELKTLAKSLSWLDRDIQTIGDFEFLHMKVGFIPQEKYEALKKSLEERSVITPLYQEGGKSLVAVLSPRDDEKIVEKVLEGSLFQVSVFPPDVSGKPARIIEEIEVRLSDISREKKRLDELKKVLRKESRDELGAIVKKVASANLHFFARSHFRATRDLIVLSGWIPKKAVEEFEKFLASKKDDLLLLKDFSPGAKINVPTKLDNFRFLRPFESLISIYGLPDYKEIDPTFYVTLGFTLMFGIMFGDLGQGLVLAFLGWFLRRKMKKGAAADIGFLVMVCGMVSAVFGLLFGSVFGFEHLIPALLFKPFEKINTMLALAIFWGVAFLSFGVILNIVNKFAEKNYVEAFLGQKGLSGVLFYYGAVLSVFGLLVNNPYFKNLYFLLGMVLVPLIFVALKDPVEFIVHRAKAKNGHHTEGAEEKGAFEIIIMAVMEVYDTILAYLSNTLSFMRVAAFSLNHVGLLLAVFAIADMLRAEQGHCGFCYWLVVVVGNIFVIVLEGMIVTIQTMRLIYYEGFSKFFSGDGIEYKPFSLRTQL